MGGSDSTGNPCTFANTLEQDLNQYLMASLSLNSKRSYSSGEKRFLQFCVHFKLNPAQALPASVSTVIYFAVYFAKTLKVGTIKTDMDWPPVHLFQWETTYQTASELRTLLGRLGLNSSHYAGHSFRIGAATSAAMVGLPSWLIKTLGRWTSNFFETYISTPVSVLCQTAQKLGAPIKCNA